MNIQHLLEISELFTIPVKTTAKALPGITPPVEHRPSKAIVHAKTSTVVRIRILFFMSSCDVCYKMLRNEIMFSQSTQIAFDLKKRNICF